MIAHRLRAAASAAPATRGARQCLWSPPPRAERPRGVTKGPLPRAHAPAALLRVPADPHPTRGPDPGRAPEPAD